LNFEIVEFGEKKKEKKRVDKSKSSFHIPIGSKLYESQLLVLNSELISFSLL
jgi:hypothetical protein